MVQLTINGKAVTAEFFNHQWRVHGCSSVTPVEKYRFVDDYNPLRDWMSEWGGVDIVRWPGHVPAGRVDDTTVLSGLDFLPTVCALAGGRVPAAIRAEGEDMSGAWLGHARARRKPLMWEWLFEVAGPREYKPPALAVRDVRWKLFINLDGSGAELYDIPADPAEKRNLAPEHPRQLKSLSKQLVYWQQSLPPSALRTTSTSSTYRGTVHIEGLLSGMPELPQPSWS